MLFALIGVEMLPELHREEEWTRSTKYEGPETSKKCITKKRSGKQPAKRKRRQQDVNQADKPITDVDKVVEAAQQLVSFKNFTVARQKAAKAVSAPAQRQDSKFAPRITRIYGATQGQLGSHQKFPKSNPAQTKFHTFAP